MLGPMLDAPGSGANGRWKLLGNANFWTLWENGSRHQERQNRDKSMQVFAFFPNL